MEMFPLGSIEIPNIVFLYPLGVFVMISVVVNLFMNRLGKMSWYAIAKRLDARRAAR